MEVLRSALRFQPRTALVAGGRAYRYSDLISSGLSACRQLESSSRLQQEADGPRVALFLEPGAAYVAGTLATWMHGGIAVPLCLSHPDRELAYVLEDAEVSRLLVSERHADRLHSLAQPLGAEVLVVEAQQQQEDDWEQQLESGQPRQQAGTSAAGAAAVEQEVQQRLEGQQPDGGALIIYTSGTTGKPKGALHTHASLAAQVMTLCSAWRWQEEDRILHTLPLHHIHGIVNALLCPLYAGACVEMMPKFMPADVWERLQREEDPVSVFMGVPTMYAQLLSLYDSMAANEQQAAAAAARKLRLTVSGSAACPTPIMDRWAKLSGDRLLERYGMTETGMLLGNPYSGERRPATVGQPFPGVEARIANPDGSDAGAGPGELRVRGQQLFREYWNRPQATAEAFDNQGFFMTGDTAVLEDGYYKLLGRTSVDVIKHGGYKISALHIESALLEHPGIAEAAVLGLPDDTYGEQIAAVIALKKPAQQQHQQAENGSSTSSSNGAVDGSLSLPELRAWLKDYLPPYQLPRRLKVVEAIPRNQMGKVNKKELRQQLFAPAEESAPN